MVPAFLLVLLVAPALAAELDADAKPEIPAHRVTWESLTAARINPLGAQESLGLYSRWRLSDSDSVLLHDTYVQAGPTVMLTPAFSRVGVAARALPLAVLQVGARAEWVRYFGTFDQILTYASPLDDWSDPARDADGAAGAHLPTGGWLGAVDLRLQAKVGPVAARYTVTGQYAALRDPTPGDGDVGYYDQTYDIVAPLQGLVVVHDTDVLLTPPGKLVAGARWTHTDPAFGADLRDGTHRVGPLVAWRFRDEPGARFNQPTLLIISQWHLVHPSRTEDLAALPYLVLAFAANGDLKPWSR